MRAKSLLVLLALGVIAGALSWAQTSDIPTLTAAEAKGHIGKKAKVCGRVVSSHYAESSPLQPTFLNLDKPYPKQVFTVLIPGWAREKFSEPEVEYKDKKICVTGKITLYRGVPEILAEEREQIEMQPEEIPAPSAEKAGEEVSVTGKLTTEGVECQALRAEDKTLYTLVGDLNGFKAGDRVCVTGIAVEVSICMQGKTLRVSSIRQCE